MADPDPDEQYQARLQAAEQAARSGDAATMLVNLFSTPVVDGLTRQLVARWPRCPRSIIDTAVATAIDTLYTSVQNGTPIRSVVAFLLKVANCRIEDFRRSTGASEQIRAPEEMSNVVLGVDADDVHRDRIRREALAVARRFLPQLGQGKVIDAMRLVFDAAEAERVDLPADEVAQALGITPNAARALISRGFQRLERLARDAGYPQRDLAALVEDLDVHELADEEN